MQENREKSRIISSRLLKSIEPRKSPLREKTVRHGGYCRRAYAEQTDSALRRTPAKRVE